jgi:O-succinylbenzoic acid--CoA ligase
MLSDAAILAPIDLAFGPVTFQELDRLSENLALTLEKLGIGPGHLIAFRAPPSPEVAALFFAAWRLNASICPLSLRLPPEQIAATLQRLKPHIYIDSFPISSPLLNSEISLPTPSLLLFTSGSTSLPKIAVLSLKNLLCNAHPAIRLLDLRPQDKYLLNLPLYHVGGISILIRSILSRAQLVLDERDPAITHMSAVPTQLFRESPVYKNLRCLLIGGAPILSYPEHLPCYLSYGMTEMGSLIAASFRPPAPFHLGFPLEGRDVRLSNGEIEVKGDCLFQGYWEAGQISKPFDPQGWFKTGDIGELSCEGLRILGRKDWQFISGGENIQPEEIESALLSLQGVFEAAVVPQDDEEFGKRPCAFVRATGSAASLAALLLEHLPKFKIPIRFLFVDEIPRNGLKINRKILAEIANKKV